jgi:hypothetical protein
MAESGQIKLRKTDAKRLSNVVKSFNAKRARIIKKTPEAVNWLPEKQSVKALKAILTTRQDFNNKVKSLERFLKKGAEKKIVTKSGVETTVWQKKEFSIQLRSVNIRRAKERKAFNPSHERGNIKASETYGLLPRKNKFETTKGKEWAMILQSVERESRRDWDMVRAKTYFNNYITMLHNNLGIYAPQLERIVRSLGIRGFVSLYFQKPWVYDSEFVYGPEQARAKAEVLIQNFEKDGVPRSVLFQEGDPIAEADIF